MSKHARLCYMLTAYCAEFTNTHTAVILRYNLNSYVNYKFRILTRRFLLATELSTCLLQLRHFPLPHVDANCRKLSRFGSTVTVFFFCETPPRLRSGPQRHLPTRLYVTVLNGYSTQVLLSDSLVIVQMVISSKYKFRINYLSL